LVVIPCLPLGPQLARTMHPGNKYRNDCS